MIFKVWTRSCDNPAEINYRSFCSSFTETLQRDVKNPWTFGYIDIHKEMCVCMCVFVCVSDVCMCAYVRLIL